METRDEVFAEALNCLDDVAYNAARGEHLPLNLDSLASSYRERYQKAAKNEGNLDVNIKVGAKPMFIVPLPKLVTNGGCQQYVSYKRGHTFASKQNSSIKQTYTLEELFKLVPHDYWQYAQVLSAQPDIFTNAMDDLQNSLPGK